MDVVVTILSILGGCSFVGTGIVAFANRRKVRADATKAGADAAAVLTESALSIVGELRGQLESTSKELKALRLHMGVLETLLRERGVPVPTFEWPQRNGVV